MPLCTTDRDVTYLLSCINQGEQTRHIKHFHYMKWPDMRVPDKLSMLDFVRLVRGYVDDSRASPIIVHCRYDVKPKSTSY